MSIFIFKHIIKFTDQRKLIKDNIEASLKLQIYIYANNKWPILLIVSLYSLNIDKIFIKLVAIV